MNSNSLYGQILQGPEPTHVVCQFLWGVRPGHRDDLVLRDRFTGVESSLNERYYCLMDYFNPSTTVSVSGEVHERYAWSAFGLQSVMAPDWEPRAESEIDWNFGFHGQFLDEVSEWYNYGYRFYDPKLGHWLGRDPVGEIGGENLYAFGANNPLNSVDYLGLADEKEIRIGFLGLNPRQFWPGRQTDPDPGWVDGSEILNASADKVFESLGWPAALDYVTTKIDQDKNGTLSKSECKGFKVLVAGFSWGAWSALIFADRLSQRREEGAEVELRIGLVDPVKFKRDQGTAARPKGVSHLVNVYQRFGLGFDIMGVKGENFVGESIAGADVDLNVTHESYTDPYSLQPKPMDHIGIWYTYGQSVVDIAFNPPG